MEKKPNADLFLLVLTRDPDDVPSIRRSLEENAKYGFRVEEVMTVRDALVKIRQNHYHLILADTVLHKESGFELLKQLTQEETPQPVVLMFETPEETLQAKAVDEGAAETIVKSECSFHDLARKLEKTYERECGNNPFFSSMQVLDSISKDRRASDGIEPSLSVSEAKESCHRDALTGLFNHSYLHERLAFEFATADRYQYPLACIFVDIDQFRKINEQYGFGKGDEFLRKAGELFFQHCRMSDIIARYGGEEFVFLLPHTTYDGAHHLATRLRTVFSENKILEPAVKESVTLSMGIACYPDDHIRERFELINFATQASLRGKVGGGNKIIRYRDMAPVLGSDVMDLQLNDDKIQAFRRRMQEVTESARRAYVDAAKMLVSAMESKDVQTAGHSASTARYARQTARMLGLATDEAEVVYYAAMLHDIGKICIPDNILQKEGKYTLKEYEVMKQHPYLGYQILKPVKFLQQEARLILHHHEWFNGRGYPDGLAGEEIPVGARIISALDAFDTMRGSGHRYQKDCDIKTAVEELIACAGTQFDPAVVEAFVEVLKKRGELARDEYDHEELEKKVRQFPYAA